MIYPTLSAAFKLLCKTFSKFNRAGSSIISLFYYKIEQFKRMQKLRDF